ncbi:MAG: hypothetical protein P4L81_06245, partial [Candidatus Pacebacteria bacterium]|nr:hypothetical protein [Candidatus Paceibacterota bacterium]
CSLPLGHVKRTLREALSPIRNGRWSVCLSQSGDEEANRWEIALSQHTVLDATDSIARSLLVAAIA